MIVTIAGIVLFETPKTASATWWNDPVKSLRNNGAGI